MVPKWMISRYIVDSHSKIIYKWESRRWEIWSSNGYMISIQIHIEQGLELSQCKDRSMFEDPSTKGLKAMW